MLRGHFRAAHHKAFRKLHLHGLRDGVHAGEIGLTLMIKPMPKLFGAKRLFAECQHFRGQFFARKANQVAPAIGQSRGGRGKGRCFRQNPRAFRFVQIKDSTVHFRAGHSRDIASWAAEKPARLNWSFAVPRPPAPGPRADARLPPRIAATTAAPSRAKAELPPV